MAEELKPQVQKTWMPMAAGIIDIIGGAYLGFILAKWLYSFFSIPVDNPGSRLMALLMFFAFSLCIAVAFYLSVAASLAFAGGIFAIKRKHWGLALAGSVFVFISPPLLLFHWVLKEAANSLHSNSWIVVILLGAAAMILLIFSKKEFQQVL